MISNQVVGESGLNKQTTLERFATANHRAAELCIRLENLISTIKAEPSDPVGVDKTTGTTPALGEILATHADNQDSYTSRMHNSLDQLEQILFNS